MHYFMLFYVNTCMYLVYNKQRYSPQKTQNINIQNYNVWGYETT